MIHDLNGYTVSPVVSFSVSQMFPLKNTDGQQESKNKLFIQGTFKKHFLYTYYVPDT